MNEPQDRRLDDLGQRLQAMGDPAPRTVPENAPRQQSWGNAPLPVGPTPVPRPAPSYEDYAPSRNLPPRQEPPISMHEHEHYQQAQVPQQQPAPQAAQSAPVSQHQLPGSEDEGPRNGLQRAVSAVKAALPFVQKLLPLLDGNVVTAVSSLLAPLMSQQARHTPPPPPVKVDLEPMERSLAEMRASHRELRNQVADQVTAMKRVEDQLERVREATDRNTLEQQELMEDLRVVGSRMSNLAVAGIILLAISLGLNIYLLFQLQHLLH